VALIVGERDATFRAIAERMVDLLPQATLHLVDGAGHAAQLERPQAVAALL
jgi:2-succinyl-6-hydroxy-2,4-cyclohexadiene-1-carboxylate synthase